MSNENIYDSEAKIYLGSGNFKIIRKNFCDYESAKSWIVKMMENQRVVTVGNKILAGFHGDWNYDGLGQIQ
jgi:hypothetical protein